MNRITSLLSPLMISMVLACGCNQSGTSPTVETSDMVNVGSTFATSGGNISDAGDSDVLQRGVCWSTAFNPTLNDNFTLDGAGTGNFVSSITNLTPITTYYLRAYASNNSGTNYGIQLSFTTQGCTQCLLQGQNLIVCESDYSNPSDYNAYINEVESSGGVCTPYP